MSTPEPPLPAPEGLLPENLTPPPSKPPEAEGYSVLSVIRQIKARTMRGKELAPEDRQACVLHLGVEGLSIPEIAEFLGVHERTIKRDRRAMREANTIVHDPAMAGQMAGQLVQEAEVAVARIRRAVRDKDTPVGVKVEAERHCFSICNEMIGRLQSLGFLPTATQNIRADLTHHIGDLSSLSEIRKEAERLEVLEQAQAPPAALPPSQSSSTTSASSKDPQS